MQVPTKPPLCTRFPIQHCPGMQLQASVIACPQTLSLSKEQVGTQVLLKVVHSASTRSHS